MENYQITLSETILSKAHSGEDTSALRRELYYIRRSTLYKKLNTDELKKMFWVNLFNAYVIIISNEPKQKISMFKRKRIKIAQYLLSLDDIQYGILRMHKYKIGFCYINNPFYSSFIKMLAVTKLDYTIEPQLNRMDYHHKKNTKKAIIKQ
jgi:hypothetical protein|nr:DUF547 domain-containing protein [uncultured Flavobacterium sp.]